MTLDLLEKLTVAYLDKKFLIFFFFLRNPHFYYRVQEFLYLYPPRIQINPVHAVFI